MNPDATRSAGQPPPVLNRRAYLRQDVSLLFADGRLADVLSKWKTNTDAIDMEKTVRMRDSRVFSSRLVPSRRAAYRREHHKQPNDVKQLFVRH